MRIAVVVALLGFGFVESAGAVPPRLLVLNKNDDSLAIVDPSTHQVVGRVPTGHVPHEVAVSADGKLAFTSNYGTGEEPGHTLSVIDLDAKKEQRRVELGPIRRPHGVYFAGGSLYFTAEANKLIGRYNPAIEEVDWLLGTGQNTTHMISLSKDLATIFTANIGSNTVSIIERVKRGGDWIQTVVPVGEGPEGYDVSPDGKELWVAHSRDGHVSIIDVASRKVVRTFDARTKRSNRLKFTPDGKTVLISDLSAGDLVVLDAASRAETKRIHLGRDVEGILVTPDGSTAYVAVAGDDFVAILDLKTLAVTGRIQTGAGPDGMAWIEGE